MAKITKKDNIIIVATTHDGKQFLFPTCIQSEVENAMLSLGFGCDEYNLGFYNNDKFKKGCDVSPRSLGVLENEINSQFLLFSNQFGIARKSRHIEYLLSISFEKDETNLSNIKVNVRRKR